MWGMSMHVLRWTDLRALSRSSFGTMTLLVPFLPFAIDLFAVLAAFSHLGEQSQIPTALEEFLVSNTRTLQSLYIGLVLFLVAKIAFEALAPDYIRRYEDVPDMRKKLMEERRLALDVDERAYANMLSTRLDGALEAMRVEDISYLRQRTFISSVFVTAFAFLLVPPIIRFVKILSSLVTSFV